MAAGALPGADGALPQGRSSLSSGAPKSLPRALELGVRRGGPQQSTPAHKPQTLSEPVFSSAVFSWPERETRWWPSHSQTPVSPPYGRSSRSPASVQSRSGALVRGVSGGPGAGGRVRTSPPPTQGLPQGRSQGVRAQLPAPPLGPSCAPAFSSEEWGAPASPEF